MLPASEFIQFAPPQRGASATALLRHERTQTG